MIFNSNCEKYYKQKTILSTSRKNVLNRGNNSLKTLIIMCEKGKSHHKNRNQMHLISI